MQDIQVGTVFRRRTLDVDRRLNDDSPCALGEIALLLPGKEIANQEQQQCDDAAEESYLAQPDAVGEQIEQCQHDGNNQGHQRRTRPTIDTHHVDQRTIPRDKEHLRFGGNLVDGFRTGHLQVEADVLVAWREQ